MTEDKVLELAKRLAEDRGMTMEQLLPNAREVATYDVDIRYAVQVWVADRIMPETPVIDGKNPVMMNNHYYAVQVFNLLNGLRNDKEQTLKIMKHLPGRKRTGLDNRVG